MSSIFKGLVHPKMKIFPSFSSPSSHPRFILHSYFSQTSFIMGVNGAFYFKPKKVHPSIIIVIHMGTWDLQRPSEEKQCIFV